MFNLSDKEECFHVERSPEPIVVYDGDRRHPNACGKECRNPHRERDHRDPSQAYVDVLPGTPSLWYIKERISRKVRKIDELIAAYQGGYNVDYELRDKAGKKKKRVPDDVVWPSKSPTGLKFVTIRRDRGVAKKKTKDRDATLHKGGFN